MSKRGLARTARVARRAVQRARKKAKAQPTKMYIPRHLRTDEKGAGATRQRQHPAQG